MSKFLTVIKSLVVIAVVGAIGYLIYIYYFVEEAEHELIIEDTPIHIESIKSIAEMSTVTFKDEIVVDSLEMEKGKIDPYDPLTWGKAYYGGVKRRLTLIVKGELHYGLDLSDGNVEIDQGNKDSIFVSLPEAKILNVILTPNETEVFQEQGTWKDSERKILEAKARKKLIASAEKLDLHLKAEKQAEKLFRKLIKTDKKLIITFGTKG